MRSTIDHDPSNCTSRATMGSVYDLLSAFFPCHDAAFFYGVFFRFVDICFS